MQGVEQLRTKDPLDVTIDFFLTSIVGILIGVGVYFALKNLMQPPPRYALCVCLFAGFTLGGSLGALMRHRVQQKPRRNSLIAPMKEDLSPVSKIVLWMFLILGCVSLGGFLLK